VPFSLYFGWVLAATVVSSFVSFGGYVRPDEFLEKTGKELEDLNNKVDQIQAASVVAIVLTSVVANVIVWKK
jgi:hypothetical protein